MATRRYLEDMDNTWRLRFALRANGLFSLGSGALALAYRERAAELLALPSWIVTQGGAVVALYGVGLVALASRSRVYSPWTVAVIALDVLWVVGSLVLLVVHPVPNAVSVVVPALAVAVLAWLQLAGLHRTMFTHGTGSYSLERAVHASAAQAWTVISDVGRYAQAAQTLHRSEIIAGDGLGMIRECEDKNGICWRERCTQWEPGRAYAFEVDTDAPGYPLPLKAMRGDFEVEPSAQDECVLRIRFTFRARRGLLTEVLLALTFALRGEAIVGAILVHWEERISDLAALGRYASSRTAARSASRQAATRARRKRPLGSSA